MRLRVHRRPMRWVGTTLLSLLATSSVACGGARALMPAPTTAVPHTSSAPSPAARSPESAEWLGLNYNSSSNTGRLEQFASQGIVYDRDGPLQVPAGETAGPGTRLGQGLRVSIASGMQPDIVVDPTRSTNGCDEDPNVSTVCIPTRPADVAAFVSGFMRTAKSVRARFPRHRVVFEPMNEPWNWGAPPGTQSSRRTAAEYAAVLARLLPAVRRSGIPLNDILVQATGGTLTDGTQWIPDLYAAQPCLRSGPGPHTCGPIEGWSLHPYGLPGRSHEGIDSVPAMHRQMQTGARNVFITEIGFCSRASYHGRGCNENQSDVDGGADQTAQWLHETLQAALAMHQAGWLQALIVWNRSGDGWGMQGADGSLTAAGRVFVGFADRYSRSASR